MGVGARPQAARRAVVLVLTIGLVVGTVLLARGWHDGSASTEPPRGAGPGAPTSSAPPPPAPTRRPAVLPSGDYLAAGRCREVFAGSAPVIPHLADQYDLATTALAVTDPAFEVLLAAPTHLGVVVLVDGDRRAARRALPAVPHLVALTPTLRALGEPGAQLLAVVEALLRPAVRDVERAVGHLPGGRALVPWPAGGAVVVGWPDPAPAAVRALAGERPDGVLVIVDEGGYSAARLHRGVHRAVRALRRAGVRGEIDGFPCLDGSGIQLSVEAGPPRDRLERLAERVAGVPVDLFIQPHPVVDRPVRGR